MLKWILNMQLSIISFCFPWEAGGQRSSAAEHEIRERVNNHGRRGCLVMVGGSNSKSWWPMWAKCKSAPHVPFIAFCAPSDRSFLHYCISQPITVQFWNINAHSIIFLIGNRWIRQPNVPAFHCPGRHHYVCTQWLWPKCVHVNIVCSYNLFINILQCFYSPEKLSRALHFKMWQALPPYNQVLWESIPFNGRKCRSVNSKSAALWKLREMAMTTQMPGWYVHLFPWCSSLPFS